MDSGAPVSLITSRLANSLQAKCHASDSNIEVIGRPLGSKHIVELTCLVLSSCAKTLEGIILHAR